MNRKILLPIMMLFSALSLKAHVPFLKPNQFRIYSNRFQIESAFTEEPFQADFAMNVPVFTMIKPNGQTEGIYPVGLTKAAVYLAPEIEADGTYHFTTGVRVGPLYNAIETSDKKLYFAEDMRKYKGKPVTMQYYSSAETYVSKGTPNYIKTTTGKGVEIVPMTSPNELFLSGDLNLKVLLDGKPVPNARVVVVYDNEHYRFHRQGDLYDVENIRKSNIYADKDGMFTFKPTQAGLVMLFVTIHEKKTPTRWESYNSSLTLEVQLP